MGMTIDKHKEHLLDIMDSMPDDACGDWRDSLAYAIETMCKYQKIEQIVRDWKEMGYDNGDGDGDGDGLFMLISGVLEDGSN